MVCLVGLGVKTLPARLNQVQSGLQSRVDQDLNAPQTQGVKAVVRGQSVHLYLASDFKGNDGAVRLMQARGKIDALKSPIEDLKLPQTLAAQIEPYAHPISTISVYDDAPPVSVMRESTTAEAVVSEIISDPGLVIKAIAPSVMDADTPKTATQKQG